MRRRLFEIKFLVGFVSRSLALWLQAPVTSGTLTSLHTCHHFQYSLLFYFTHAQDSLTIPTIPCTPD